MSSGGALLVVGLAVLLLTTGLVREAECAERIAVLVKAGVRPSFYGLGGQTRSDPVQGWPGWLRQTADAAKDGSR